MRWGLEGKGNHIAITAIVQPVEEGDAWWTLKGRKCSKAEHLGRFSAAETRKMFESRTSEPSQRGGRTLRRRTRAMTRFRRHIDPPFSKAIRPPRDSCKGGRPRRRSTVALVLGRQRPAAATRRKDSWLP